MARILVVEDDRVSREGLCRLLEAAGHEALAAENGVEALRLLSDTTVDLVLADVYMPAMDGLELTMRLYEHHADAPVVVIMSGGGTRSASETLEDAAKLGVKHTLAKPFGTDEMIAMVDNALAQS